MVPRTYRRPNAGRHAVLGTAGRLFGRLPMRPAGDGDRWTGRAQSSVGHFGGVGAGALALNVRMRMGIFGTDYQVGAC